MDGINEVGFALICNTNLLHSIFFLCELPLLWHFGRGADSLENISKWVLHYEALQRLISQLLVPIIVPK